jgi:hypothetical protein
MMIVIRIARPLETDAENRRRVNREETGPGVRLSSMSPRWSRAAAIAGPAVVAVMPKCPLCLLPLCAALGISVPSAPAVNAVLALIAAVWLRFAVRHVPLAPAAVAVTLAITGRLVHFAALSWSGVALMLVLSLVSSRRETCHIN